MPAIRPLAETFCLLETVLAWRRSQCATSRNGQSDDASIPAESLMQYRQVSAASLSSPRLHATLAATDCD
jgi:hypothetical protein